MDIIINHIKTDEDNVCVNIRNTLNSLPKLADILVLHYLSIRAVYDIPPLLNINYRNHKPTTHSIFGIDKVLLCVLLIQIECSNAILNYINTFHNEKIDKIYDILDNYINIDINVNILKCSPENNFNEYVSNINKYVSKLLEILN